MISPEVLEAQPRPAESRGKNEARRLRASGRVPAVVYGAKKDAVAVSVDPKHISKILRSASGHNTIFDLQVGAEKTKAMIVDWQYEPIKGKLLHIDMKRIAMDEKIRVKIPIHLVGEAAGVKTQGGIMDQVLREVPLSRRSLEKRFMQTTGYPVYEYIYNQRIEKFTQKLLETDLTIFEIALDLGLTDSKNIARQFKQIKGLTPVEYRKKYMVAKQPV